MPAAAPMAALPGHAIAYDPGSSRQRLRARDRRPGRSDPAAPAPGACRHGTGLGFAIPGAIVLATLSQAVLDWPWFLLALAGALAGLLLGGTLGLRRHRRIGWKLDQDGFATRRGGLWRNETLVPVSRVQHLDLERGPLERQLGLATLVVHTAGTRMAAVKLPLLALEDAQALRALLARQVETDDAL